MVGNDIVDLRDHDSDIASYRGDFDARVFTASERKRLAQSREPTRERWRLWAAKEAAYKLARQFDPATVFSPRKFEVCAAGVAERALVKHGKDRFFVCLDETPEHIHAIAVKNESELSGVVSRVGILCAGEESNESTAVRTLACDTIAEHFTVPRASLEIRKEGRIPKLYAGDRPMGLDVSLSHHGQWVAFACHEGEARVV